MSEASPLVTVAMAMRDAARTLPAALASLLHQDYENWELVLTDDGSRDDSVKVAGRFADPRIRLLADGRRRGLGARLNEAVDAARGELIARMDADDISYASRFSRQVAFLQAHPEVDVVAAAMVVFAGTGEPVGLYRVAASHEEICARPWAGFYFPHPTWMGRAAWFRRHRYDAAATKAQDQGVLLRAYATSRFAGIEAPLLGYRQDEIALKKVLAGRYHFSRALLRAKPGLALRALPEQVAKAAFDVLAVASGLERRLLRHRARPLAAAHAEEWHAVWRAVCGEMSGAAR